MQTITTKHAERDGIDYAARGGSDIHGEAVRRYPQDYRLRRAFVTAALDKLAAAADSAAAHWRRSAY